MIKNNRELIYEGVSSNYLEAETIICGIPFDGTVSFRPGTRFAPSAIRQVFDGIETYSPYLNSDLTDKKICDLGDIPISFGNTTKTLQTIEQEIASILDDNKKIISLGGEHLITYPIIKSYIKKYPSLNIIHFDAHADLRDTFMGETLSHATVMRRVYEQLSTGQIWQFGIRSGTKEEFIFGQDNTSLHPFSLDKITDVINQIGDAPVYISIDLDVLDPSIFPGTGTPEPGGNTFIELMDAMKKLTSLQIVGGDIVELTPNYDASGVSTIVACKVLRELLLLI